MKHRQNYTFRYPVNYGIIFKCILISSKTMLVNLRFQPDSNVHHEHWSALPDRMIAVVTTASLWLLH
jgi:hypothetical protein